MYAVMLQDLKALVNPSKRNPAASNVPAATPTDPNESAEVDGFRVPRRRKRISSGEQEEKKNAGPHTSVEGKTACRVENRNYFAPLSTTPAMDCAEMERGLGQEEQQTSASPGRPPPIVLTTPTNLLQLQKGVKGLVKGNFEFRSTRNRTRVVTREMADYSAIRALFDGRNMNYYTFHAKSDKPIKAVIRNLPIETPAEDICNGLSELGFSVMSVRQLTSNRRPPEGDNQRLPLFLITLKKLQNRQRSLN
jgi:hypothetical protein